MEWMIAFPSYQMAEPLPLRACFAMVSARMTPTGQETPSRDILRVTAPWRRNPDEHLASHRLRAGLGGILPAHSPPMADPPRAPPAASTRGTAVRETSQPKTDHAFAGSLHPGTRGGLSA